MQIHTLAINRLHIVQGSVGSSGFINCFVESLYVQYAAEVGAPIRSC
jgi:hypothetical protein